MSYRTTSARAAILCGILAASSLLAIDANTQSVEAASREAGAQLKSFDDWMTGTLPVVLAENRVPGAVVAVIRDGKVTEIRPVGFADRDKNRLMTADTQFSFASMSKTVAAWGVMRLVEDGRIDLDAPVSRYVKRWRLPDSEFDADGVTVRRLLSHTAGLSLHGYEGGEDVKTLPTLAQSLSGQVSGARPSTATSANERMDVRIVTRPGTVWSYSGGGYTLLELMVEDVTGQDFASYMQTAVLKPLQMANADFRPVHALDAAHAQAYGANGAPIATRVFAEGAAAGLNGDVRDFANFALATISLGKAADGQRLLSEQTVRLMTTPLENSGMRGLVNFRYGLGYTVEDMPDGTVSVGHGGHNTGWVSSFQVRPDQRDGLVVLTNGENGYTVVEAIKCQWRHATTGQAGPAPCARMPLVPLISSYLEQGMDGLASKFQQVKASSDYATGPETLPIMIKYLGAQRPDLARDAGFLKDVGAILEYNMGQYPQSATAALLAAQQFAEIGNKDKQCVYMRQALTLDPKTAVTLQERAQCGL